nr:cytochrome c oxidase subunit III [Asiopsocus sonorensis]
MMKQNHPFHLVSINPWPILVASATMFLMSGSIQWFNKTKSSLLSIGLLLMLITLIQWWRDIIRESNLLGDHPFSVMTGLQMGMILFILSEILFFASFFWAFFHCSISTDIELGYNWPPKGVNPFSPFSIPLINTLILLSSGASITWAHHSILMNNSSQTFFSLLLTFLLAIYFIILQAFEYMKAPFSIVDSIYGTTFFLTTGFHGLHVIIGSMMILTTLIRHMKNQFSKFHHFMFEAAAWYWHFVDVIWLFLFLFMYWWAY